MITGWRLGAGPCGANCSKTNIGTGTSLTRHLVEKQHNDPLYFGTWTIETSDGVVTVRKITDEIKTHLKGDVSAVSEAGKWEQEHTSIIYTLNSDPPNGRLDIVYEVVPMLTLPLQRPIRDLIGHWHLQAKIDVRTRSDTGRPNFGPIALIKPVYRLRLDRINQIQIPVVDPDGDFVRCFPSLLVEAGTLSMHKLPGFTVDENCTVTINTSSSMNYTDGLWGGVAVTARDFNRQEITVGGIKQTGLYSLTGTAIQFLVHIVDALSAPVFVQPTPPGNSRYNVYLGSTWRVNVAATAPANTKIVEFLALSRLGEILNVSSLTGDDRQHNVWQATVSWKPGPNDTGGHVFCVRAVDENGVDTPDDSCYIVEVKLPVYKINSTMESKGRPYFVDLPSTNDALSCDVDVTCIYPIYIHSPNALMSVRAEGDLDTITTGPVYQTVYSGNVLYTTDLHVMNKTYGIGDICLTATDVHGTSSNRICLRQETIPIDPCLSFPCKNSAKCSRKPDDPTDYQCTCFNSHDFEGKNCDRKENKACESNPCKHGARCFPKRSSEFICLCRGTGYTGPTCDQALTTTIKPSQPSSTCQDDKDFPCHSNFNMCSDRAIAEKYCRQTCNLCDNTVAIVG